MHQITTLNIVRDMVKSHGHHFQNNQNQVLENLCTQKT